MILTLKNIKGTTEDTSIPHTPLTLFPGRKSRNPSTKLGITDCVNNININF